MSPRTFLLIIAGLFVAPPAGAESFQSWAARGAREEREKDFAAAFSSYSNALTMWTDEDGAAPKARVLCARAGLREKDGADEAAIADLSDCLAIDKKNAKGFHRRGSLLLKTGKTAPAIGDFYKAVALDIRFAQAYADRARAYEIQGESGFAREDYKRACDLGAKAACAKVSGLKPKRSPAKATRPPATAPAPEPVERPPEKTRYLPRFEDCLHALGACADAGGSFGSCVRAAPACERKAVKGCCPSACLGAFQASLNRDRSEADAYRRIFKENASCAAPPKTDENE
ncbi:MAG: hypothetical protein HYZ74_02315 [Elusimicrobia bacterium]|nr:hypothetical protein [Elusimicrobiota bacterium]